MHKPLVALLTGLDSTVCDGVNPVDVGAKCFRIGGSTDWKERSGSAGIHIIKRRGRWASDVALIYQRDLIAEQLEAAADAGNASGMDLEGLCDDFVTRAR